MFELPAARARDTRPRKAAEYRYDTLFPEHVDMCGEPWDVLSRHIGEIRMGGIYNFWTFGRYAMADIINHLLRQTGPADVMATTWSLNTRSVQELVNRKRDGLLRSFRMWIDPRVHRAAPEPLQLLRSNFETVIAPVHAKVTVIGNKDWKISVCGSVNFTSNPQPERGVIQCIPEIYETDRRILDGEFAKGDRLRLSDVDRDLR